MPTYRPEGLQNQPIPTPEVLRRAGGSREIFQAMCIKCDEFHNLVVDLGCLRGLIPREETALGIADGSARDIFWNEEVVSTSRIRKTAIGELAKELQIGERILYCDEMVEEIARRLGR